MCVFAIVCTSALACVRVFACVCMRACVFVRLRVCVCVCVCRVSVRFRAYPRLKAGVVCGVFLSLISLSYSFVCRYRTRVMVKGRVSV